MNALSPPPTIDLSATQDELDQLAKVLPGYRNRLTFSHDSESGDYIATHYHQAVIWHTGPYDLMFGKRGKDPFAVMGELRRHLRECVA